MDTDSVSGDVDSLHGGLSLLDPLLDRILVDTVSQLQGWLRVYGKDNTGTGALSPARYRRAVTGTEPGNSREPSRVMAETGAAQGARRVGFRWP